MKYLQDQLKGEAEKSRNDAEKVLKKLDDIDN